MDRFDELITRDDLLMHGRTWPPGPARSGLWVGTTSQPPPAPRGEPGIFVWDIHEWANVLASYSWAGASVRLTTRTKMAVVSSTAPSHQSALVGASVDSRFIPTLRVDSGEQLEDVVRRSTTSGPTFWWGTPACWGCWRGAASRAPARAAWGRPQRFGGADRRGTP